MQIMKSLNLLSLFFVFSILTLHVYCQDTYNPTTDYNKGNIVDITINSVLITVEYLNDQPSSTFETSTPL
jgi:hypothetical protein